MPVNRIQQIVHGRRRLGIRKRVQRASVEPTSNKRIGYKLAISPEAIRTFPPSGIAESTILKMFRFPPCSRCGFIVGLAADDGEVAPHAGRK